MHKEKYVQMIKNRIQSEIAEWSNAAYITEKELYAFLHNLKGTAGSIGLPNVSTIAEKQLQALQEGSNKLWPTKQWTELLTLLLEELDLQQELKVLKIKSKEQAPLKKVASYKDFILVIDDDHVFISFIKSLLERQGYSVLVANNGKRGLELLYKFKPSIVFLDIMLPDVNGFHIFEEIVAKVKKHRIIVAIMSANNSTENIVRAYNVGAFDFIAKPINPKTFIAYVENRLAFKNEIEHSIIIDELTQMYNRKYMDLRLQELIEQFERTHDVFSLAILDLDYFKKVNDTYGHLVGDDVLKGFAAAIKEIKLRQDVDCRYGGEEFAILFPYTTAIQADKAIQTLREAMTQKYFQSKEGLFQITFSAGIAEINATNTHPQQLIREADKALYEAKLTGRNKNIIYSSILAHEKVDKHMTIVIIDEHNQLNLAVTDYFQQQSSDYHFTLQIQLFTSSEQFKQDFIFVQNEKYIVLVDYLTAAKNEFSIIKNIRAQYSSQEVIIAFLSEREYEQHVIQALEYGADDYVLKPLDLDDISARLWQIMKTLFN